MRDHAIGAYGAVALVLVLAVKVAAISALVEAKRADAYLVVAPAVARWATVHKPSLMWSDELLFFAVVCLLPAVFVISDAAKARHTLAVSVGCAALSMGLVTLIGLVAVIGRLTYPVFGIALSADIVALLVSLIFGVLHLVLLLFGVGLIAAALAMRGGRAPRWMAVAGYVIGASQFAASFPWLTPLWWNATTTVALAATAVTAGAYLIATAHKALQRPDALAG